MRHAPSRPSPNSNRLGLTRILAAVAATCALALLCWPAGEASPELDTRTPPPAPDQPVDSRATNAGRVDRRETESPVVQVVDTEGKGIEGASVWLRVTTGVSGTVLSGDPFGVTDAAGSLVVARDDAGAAGCVRRRGYVSQNFSVAQSGVTQVRMERSRSIVVEASSQHGPVADCLVLLTLRQSVPVDAALESAPSSEGTLDAQVPIWRSVTGRDGTCEFDAPTDAPLWLAVYHDAMYPVESVALAIEPVAASRDARRVRVTMQDMLGIAVALPDDSTFACHVWNYDSSQRSHEMGALARYRYCKARLEQRMPHCVAMTFAARTPLEECRVEVAALDTIGREWALETALVPLRTLQRPAYAELVAGPAPAVVDVNLQVQGRRIEGEPMRLGKISKNGKALSFHVLSGSTLTVPAGVYALDLEHSMDFGPELPRPNGVHVPEGSRVELAVTVPYEVVRLTITPRIEDEPMNVPFFVTLGDEDMDPNVNARWSAESGPLCYWVVPGEYRLSAQARDLPVTTRTIPVPTGAKSIVIDDFVIRR